MCRSRTRRWAELPDTTARSADVAVDGPAPWARSGSDRSIRASDRDRETVVALLGEHTGAGRLTLTEFEERVGEAATARTLADLDGLLTDLPAATPPRPQPRPARPTRIRRLDRWMPWLHASVICVAIWAVTSILAGGPIAFWPFWVIVPWGVVLLAGGWSSPRRRRLVR
jgi:hypothetical protein